MFRGDFSFIRNELRLHSLTVLGVFTVGSATGLVSLSHLLSFVLKQYRHMTTAVIIGFITGSLGVVWPWKKTVYKVDGNGSFLTDSNGKAIIMNYERYFPELSIVENWWAILFIILGAVILLSLDWYGKKRRALLNSMKT